MGINVRTTKEQDDNYKRAAKIKGRSASSWIRRTLDQEAENTIQMDEMQKKILEKSG